MAAFAADVTGNWKASMEGPQGAMELTFALKQAGTVVSGSINSPMGETKLDEGGKLDGDKISFSMTMDFGKITYSGTVAGDEMKLTMAFGGGGMGGDMPPMPPLVAKRVK